MPPAITDDVLQAITQRLSQTAAEHDRAASFPFENFKLLQQHGLLALTVPKRLGGGEADLATARRVVRAVAQGEPSTALVLIMQYNFQRMVAYDPGWPEDLRARIGGAAVTNGALINALSVEPELGTPQRGGMPATIGIRDRSYWRVSGRKIYATGIPALTWLAIIGRTDEPEPRFGLFVVRRDTPGISVLQSWDHLGMRATHSHEAVLENVQVPLEDFVPMQPFGARTDAEQLARLAWGSVLLGTLYNAIAQSARDWLVGFLRERAPSNLGAPLATLPRMQGAVGTIEALLFANNTLLDAITAKIDGGAAIAPAEGSLVKYLVTKNAIEAVAKALELTGNHGLSRNNPLERHYRDVLCSRIHTPQNDVILTGAGRQALAA